MIRLKTLLTALAMLSLLVVVHAGRLADGAECWSQAYVTVSASGSDVLHCSPPCDETCLQEIMEDPELGSLLVCNCDDEGDPTECCQIARRGGGAPPVGVGVCGTPCDSFPVCRTLVAYDPGTKEYVWWARCLN